jgi:hypothetical protein
MPYPLQSIAHDRGVWPGNIDGIPLFVRGAAAVKGETWMNDYTASDAATSTAGASSLGTTTSVWMNMIKPTSGGLLTTANGAFFGVCQAGVADDGVTTFKLYGFVSALVFDASASVIIGDALVANTDAYLDAIPVNLERMIAVAQGGLANATTATSVEVFFNGIGHIGQGADHATG